MKAPHLLALLLLAPLFALTACDDDDNDDNGEFTYDWQNRNAVYFAQTMEEAKADIAKAQAEHPADWEAHTPWRVARSYAKVEGAAIKQTDSICYRIIESGTGSGCPLYTDSVRINYTGRLMPTESYAEGRVFDHSGLYETDDYVFSPQFSAPSTFLVGGVVEGLTTALLYMHIGDRWRVYIPQELGYQSASSGVMPGYSTLVFDVQLKSYFRK